MHKDTEQRSAYCIVSDLLNVGVYILATDEFALVPPGFFNKKDKKKVKNALRVPLVESMIGGTSLLGVLAVATSRVLLLPQIATDLEIEELQAQLGIEVCVLDSKITALGNVIVVNDKGALVSSVFNKKDIHAIEDMLGVTVAQRNLAGISVVGAMCVVTSRGALVSPLASDDEVKQISCIFEVKTDICTVNRGYAYISTGLTANAGGGLCGADTTGIERARIIDILF
ncbi:MAG: translation initiation factor IF-6 [Candidatus Heimdallarchaeota archaeon]